MIKKAVCIISQSHLSKNPRVLKEAIAIAVAGHKVDIVNSIFSEELSLQDLELIKGLNIKIHSISDLRQKNTASFFDKLARKFGQILIEKFNLENSLAMGYGISRYLSYCKNLNSDLYIGHQEVGLYVGNQLLKENYKVAFDFEDWYSEDLLVKAQKKRPIKLLKKLEKFALQNAFITYTTSKVLANELAIAYQEKEPKVVYNVFKNEANTIKINEFKQPLKLIWFSQTVGEGRGLEDFINLLLKCETIVELNLLGDIDNNYKNSLENLVNENFTIHFHPLVAPNELVKKLAEFDIGLALEKTKPLSRDLTITNKFFQYLHAGLPIICSQTKGQEEIFNLNKPGLMLKGIAEDAESINDFISNPLSLNIAREMATKTAMEFKWELENTKLIKYLDLV